MATITIKDQERILILLKKDPIFQALIKSIEVIGLYG